MTPTTPRVEVQQKWHDPVTGKTFLVLAVRADSVEVRQTGTVEVRRFPLSAGLRRNTLDRAGERRGSD